MPEYEADCPGACRKIDVVWAIRSAGGASIWSPVAAFEIEGHPVHRNRKSIVKDADSLTAAGAAGATVLALVLFQVGPGGGAWYARSPADVARVKERNRQRAERRMLDSLDAMKAKRVDVVLDEQVHALLENWVDAAKRARDRFTSGRATRRVT